MASRSCYVCQLVVDEMKSDVRRCFRIVWRFCCKIPEVEDMSVVMQGVALPGPFLRCLGTMQDICDLQKSNKQQQIQAMLQKRNTLG